MISNPADAIHGTGLEAQPAARAVVGNNHRNLLPHYYRIKKANLGATFTADAILFFNDSERWVFSNKFWGQRR
ncbi:MAG: hypothetical protein AABZ61_14645 [Bacteroidota bacterium]